MIAKLQRRPASWPVLGVLLAALVGLQVLDVVAPAAVLVAVALIVLVWWRRRRAAAPARPDQHDVQAPGTGLIGFDALAHRSRWPSTRNRGSYLVAAGWFLPGIWDFVHLRLDEVVARSYAEACGVLDIVVAAGLVLLS